MADLLTAIARASKRIADPRAMAYASSNRLLHVIITRPVVLPTFDRSTMTLTNPADQVLYDGAARIAPASGGAQLDVGGEQTTYSSVTVSVDDFPPPGPRVDDLMTVVADDVSYGAHLAGRVFTITSVDVGGQFDIGLSFSATGAEPSRRT